MTRKMGSTSNAIGLLLALILGIGAFFLVVGPSLLDPSNIGQFSKEYSIKTCCLTLSHLDIIKTAYNKNYDNVIIFEDD